ncbi:MAG: pseudouridine-5'-phosphate glycosidase, partial [Actinomycetota bacterium]|nr:pseudouridine-5'-phosphate glycosidase [Actinomycetota bacterium]
ELTGDISADLDAIARRAVVTVSAGAKAFLDLARTLEYLETAGAPVVGWQTNEFPAFYTRTSGLNVPHRVETAEVVAAIFHNRTRADQGVLLAVPIPELDSLDAGRLDAALASALEECEAQEIRGAAITPFLLERITVATDGDSLPANLALAEHNAEVAAQVAVAIAQLG